MLKKQLSTVLAIFGALWLITGSLSVLTSYPFHKAPYVNYLAVHFNRAIMLAMVGTTIYLTVRYLKGDLK